MTEESYTLSPRIKTNQQLIISHQQKSRSLSLSHANGNLNITTNDRVKSSLNLFTIEEIEEVEKMDRLENSLTMEQELNHRIFSDRVQHLSGEEAQELLVMMHKQMMFKDNLYKELFLNQEKDIVNSLFGEPKN